MITGPAANDLFTLRAAHSIERACAGDPELCRPVPDLARLANDPAVTDLVQRRDVVGLLGNSDFQRVLTHALAPTPNAG